MKVKIFRETFDSSEKIETKINRWLNKQVNVNMIDMLQSIDDGYLIITIFYEGI